MLLKNSVPIVCKTHTLQKLSFADCKTEFKWSLTSHTPDVDVSSNHCILPPPTTSSTTPEICAVDVITLSNRVWRSAFESIEDRCRHHSATFVSIRSFDKQSLTSEAVVEQEKRFLAVYLPYLRSYFSVLRVFIATAGDEWIAGCFPVITNRLTSLYRICCRKWVVQVAKTSSGSDDENKAVVCW